MAKKRRDKERDSSSIGKVTKVGAAALSIGGGAAALSKSGFTRKFTSEIAPSIIGTTKAIKKDLSVARAGRTKQHKSLKMQDVYDTYHNHLKDNKTFKKELKNNNMATKNIKINTDNKRTSHLGAIKNYYQNKNNVVERELKEAYKKERQQSFLKTFIIPNHKDKNAKLMAQLNEDIFGGIDSNVILNKDGTQGFAPFVDKQFERLNFTNIEKEEYLKAVMDEKEKIEDVFKRKTWMNNIKDDIDILLKKKVLEGKKQSDTFLGKLSKKIGIDDLESKLFGSRALTVGEFIDAVDNNKINIDSRDYSANIKNNSAEHFSQKWEKKDLINQLKSFSKEDEGFKDVILDNALRIDGSGNIYDTSTFNDELARRYRKFSSSMPGSLFGQTDARLRNETPILKIFETGKTGIESTYELGEGTILRSSKIAIANPRTGVADLYNLSLNENGALELGEKLSDEGLIDNALHGKTSRLLRNTLGSNRNPLNKGNSVIEEVLDFNQSGAPSFTDKLKAWFTKNTDPDYTKNVLNRNKALTLDDGMTIEQRINTISLQKVGLFASEQEHSNMKAEISSRLLKDVKELSALLNDHTAMHQVDDDTIEALVQASNNGFIKNTHSKKILGALSNDNLTDMQLLEEISSSDIFMNFEKLYNKDLENIVNRGLVNTDHILHMQNISQSKIASLLPESTNVMEVRDIIRREALKEVMLREGAIGANLSGRTIASEETMEVLERILNLDTLTKEQSSNLRYLANWGIMQSSLELYNDTDATIHLDKMIGPNGNLSNFEKLLDASPNFKSKYTDMLDELSSKYHMFDPGVIGNINETYSNEYNSHAYIKKSKLNIDNLLAVNSINDAIKLAGQVKDELLAGRHDLKNYTTLTQASQFMVNRLSWGVEEIGLGLSGVSTGSSLDTIKNIALKRVLPAMAIYNMYDYLDYESENLTGISMTGAAANTLSNIDIASRKLAYSTGIGQALNWAKDSSVWGEYWTGTTEYQNAEERQDWYENGYQAVRGGRLWGFGSTSEYRGSSIQFYQPNYLKRAHSNWKEIGIYGSAEEKFKHSWLPSLRHPLSPLKAAFDPYWLEKENMEDRPYPMTGKMFAEGTPWGAVLNPTVGELLKPVRTLPETRRRLGKDGRDIRAVVENINERIKNRSNDNDDMMIARGTDIRNASYIPYASPNDNSINLTFRDGIVSAPGIGYMQDVSNLQDFIPANGAIKENMYEPVLLEGDTELAQVANTMVQDVKQTSYNTDTVINEILSSINQNIKNIGAKINPYGQMPNSAYQTSNLPDLSQGTYVYQNLVNKRNVFNSNYYSDNFDYKLVDKNLMNNYAKDFTSSARELTGIYNFLGEFAFGEESWSFELENANAMTSFSRHFWDAQAGGIGGDVMEIARRFFASEDKTRIKYNPLRNSMEDWLPSRFLTGDPYTELPKGEMRLPGKGYESLHDLNPDSFGVYGAFDRMKILGDVAPTSEEYKIWRNIARNTVVDEELIKQMDEIEKRAQKMSSKHEFYDYRYYNNNIDIKHGVVKSWKGNIVTLSSGEQLRLGGITLNKEADMSQLLSVGQKIHYGYSKDAIKRLEDGIVTNAVIYEKSGVTGVNINNTLVDMGMAERDDKDKSAVGYIANASTMQQTLGMIQEMIGHANIPILHNKYLKIETARESFENEHIYGTSFATWDNPVKGFVVPALNKTFGQSPLEHAAAIGSSALYFKLKENGIKGMPKVGAAALMATANPSAMLGAGIEFTTKLGAHAIGGGSNLLNVERGAKVGSIVGTIGWGLANAENPIKAAMSFAMAGETLNTLMDTVNVVDKAGNKVFKNAHGKGALIGAGIGLGISAIKNPNFSKDMFRKKWVPKETEKMYELDEYFDRLTYVKYKGLYEQAALRASLFEGSHNIKSIFRRLDKNKEKIAKLTRKAEKLSNKETSGGYEYEQEMAQINNKIMSLESQQIAFKGGKYTKAAVAYKKAMDSTIYGMNEGSTSDEILSAIPVQYKDHYVAFMNETSKSEREKILKQLPEYLQKPLQVAWGQKVDKVDSNMKYFKKHALPNMAWKGWKPNINMKHVKMKTIQNEGMLLSDFGYYDSEKSKMQYHIAPGIDNYDNGSSSSLSYLANMTTALSGLGMTVQNISVEPTSAPGLWIMGDIKQTAKDVGKIGDYAIQSGVQTLTSLLF